MSACPVCYRDLAPVAGRCPACGAEHPGESVELREIDDEPTYSRGQRGGAGGARVPSPPAADGAPRLILKGAAGSPIGPERSAEYAALNNMTGAAIETAIERLVEQGRLRRSNGPRPLLSIANSNATAPANVVQ